MQCEIENCDDITKAKGLCAKHYFRLRRKGDANATSWRDTPPSDRFWGRVNRFGPLPDASDPLVRVSSRCWVWDKPRPDGYGQVWLDGVRWYVHIYSWTEKRGRAPEGVELDHLCRNKSCVRQDHLEPVSHRENIRRAFQL